MKKIILALFSIGFLGLLGCKKFLDEKPQTQLDQSQFWKNEDDIKLGLTGMYDGLQLAFDNNYTIWGDSRADEVETTIYGDDAYVVNGISAATTGADWTPFYKTIMRANLAIKNIPIIKQQYVTAMDPKVVNYYLMQAHGVRAYCYFWIVRLWGDAPYWSVPITDGGPDARRARIPANQILDSIQADLEKAAMMAENATGTPSVFEMNRGAIYAMLQDVAMWRKDYTRSITWFNKLDGLRVGSARRYDTIPRGQWKQLFTDPNGATNKESIWSLHWDYLVDGGADVSALIGAGNTNSDFVVEDSVWRYWTVTALQDIRGPQTIDFKVSARDKFNKFYALNLNASGNQIYPNNNEANILFPLYRFSDMLLLRAEAANKLGDMTNTLKYLNMVRIRSGMPAYTAAQLTTPAVAENIILEERKLEFYMEARRWFDLIRTDKIITVMDPVYYRRQARRGTVPTGFGDPRTVLWPLHRTVLNSNPALIQNPPY